MKLSKMYIQLNRNTSETADDEAMTRDTGQSTKCNSRTVMPEYLSHSICILWQAVMTKRYEYYHFKQRLHGLCASPSSFRSLKSFPCIYNNHMSTCLARGPNYHSSLRSLCHQSNEMLQIVAIREKKVSIGIK